MAIRNLRTESACAEVILYDDDDDDDDDENGAGENLDAIFGHRILTKSVSTYMSSIPF